MDAIFLWNFTLKISHHLCIVQLFFVSSRILTLLNIIIIKSIYHQKTRSQTNKMQNMHILNNKYTFQTSHWPKLMAT
jgi:hypothetical protein